MIILLIGVILFLYGAILNIINGNMGEAVVGLIIAGTMFGLYQFFKIERKKANNFISWILSNRQEIEAGGASFNGSRITLDTEITQYQACLSFLIASFKLPSKFFIKGYEPTSLVSFLYTFVSFILGWWGLPWGPIYTIQVIASNLRGGSKTTVRALLVHETQK